MIIVQFWLEQLFNCAFERVEFINIMFNPEMINLLFDNDTTIVKQFHVKTAAIITDNSTFEKFLEFSLNRFAIYNSFNFLNLEEISDQQTNILFDIIINEGNKFPRVWFGFLLQRLHDLIIEYITKSKDDFSKMVPAIVLNVS
uniref:Uncharacterized protein n=1 Tax=Meloidogyne incognita TaxID=6306 RepID=A0A914LL18_MELIC